MTAMPLPRMRRISCLCFHWTTSGSRAYSKGFLRPPPATEKPTVETFSAPSGPMPVFTPPRQLPPQRKLWPTVLLFSAVGLGGWVAFYGYVINETKVTSSVVKQILRRIGRIRSRINC
ncbi:hypothetical protein C8J57DRAFT_1308687 [Mycena rebaudengoi]|nr:hypothetical protein C8J57DRAFT_1308687 [Mycena rebaudengoi]